MYRFPSAPTPHRFLFTDNLAKILDDVSAFKDRLLCKATDSMNWRIVEGHQIGGLRPFEGRTSCYRNGPRAVLGSQRRQFGKDVGVFSRVLCKFGRAASRGRLAVRCQAPLLRHLIPGCDALQHFFANRSRGMGTPESFGGTRHFGKLLRAQ